LQKTEPQQFTVDWHQTHSGFVLQPARRLHVDIEKQRLIQNPRLSVHDIAREERVSAAYLYSLLCLPWLAPDITTAIINGRKPPQLTAQTLMRLTPRLPAGWAEQRKLLGFH
jgi:hypothetical protein